MKIQRPRLPVIDRGTVVDEVSAIVKIPRGFRAGHTSAVVLAHGAGGGFDDPLLTYVQSYLVGRGFLTLGFNFPYREKGRKTPDREPLLEATVRSAVDFLRNHETLKPGRLLMGGRSMGGRMASHLVAGNPHMAMGLILLAYPLHAPGRPDRVRDKHLPSIAAPTLFVSGTRDALAPLPQLQAAVKKVRRSALSTIDDADHSFKILKRSGRTQEDVWYEVADQVANWAEVLVGDVGEPQAPLTPASVERLPGTARTTPK
ncbi:MAG: hypothetical protein EB084_00640 [Proteobacteria bacterium]|nr:hypothetical protein [Pseudomonadota bacterium]